MTSLTLITLAVVVFGIVNSRGYGRALALGGATAAGAALAVGGIAVPTFYAVAIGAAVALAIDLLRSEHHETVRRRLPPGVSLLLLFLAWSSLVTLLAPVLFSGLTVQLPVRDGELLAGYVTPSNVAQVGYLFLGICVVVFLARSPHSRPQLLGLAVCTTTLLSFWRLLHGEVGVPFPEGLFDNSPTLAFIETAPGGEERFRGILSEPSSLAASSLVTIGYCLSRSTQVHGWHRAGVLGVAAAAAYMGSISTSTSFTVASVIIAVLAGTSLTLGFALRRFTMSAAAGVALCGAFVAALWVLPFVVNTVAGAVDDKVGTDSYTDRSSTDLASYDVFFNTLGLGSGLGANRAASFIPGLLSTTGIVGTVLFVLAVGLLVSRAAALRSCRPVIWALISLLVLKIVAGPDISDSSGVLWISLGLLSHAVARADHAPSRPTGLGRRAPLESGPAPGEVGADPWRTR